LGYRSLRANTSGTYNSAVGVDALLSNTTGSENVAVGGLSLTANTTGTENTAIGYDTLVSNTTGTYNVAVGNHSLELNTSSYNIAVGGNTLINNSTGTQNTVIGYNTGNGITTGSYNTILGANVIGLGATLSNNIILADGQGNRRINVDSSGNVGIGTTTPTAKLDVTSTGTASYSASALPTATISTPTTGTINAAYTSIHLGARGQFGQGQAVAITNVPTADGDSAMAFTTQNAYAYSEKMRITAAGNVGIGTTTPASKLVVVSDDPSQVSIESASGNFNAQLNFKPSGTGIAYIKNQQNTDFAFGTNNTEQMRITNNGYLRMAAGTGGIQFNGDTAAANALDDYEEGTWTMGVTFGGASVGVTTSLNTGTYTKIGRQVTVNGYLILTNKGSSSGAASITGLPFTIANSAANYSACTLRFEAITFTNQFQAFGNVNSTVIPLEEITILGAVTSITDLDFANNSAVIVSFTYFV